LLVYLSAHFRCFTDIPALLASAPIEAYFHGSALSRPAAVS